LGTKSPTDLDLIVIPPEVLHNKTNNSPQPHTRSYQIYQTPFATPTYLFQAFPMLQWNATPIIQQQYQQQYQRHPPHHHARTNHHAARCTVPGKRGRADPPHHPHWKKEKKEIESDVR